MQPSGRSVAKRTDRWAGLKLRVHLFSITLTSSSIFQMAGRWEKLIKQMTGAKAVKQSAKWAAGPLISWMYI